MSAEQIKLIRKYLKLKVMEDNISFTNHKHEREHVYDLMKRTVLHGESHSALMLGPRGSGKTTLINSVLHQLSKEVDISSDAIIVKLNGLLHHEEKVALKSITAQMQLENAVGDRVFGTFAENLSFLLSCLQSGSDRRCKSMIFILEEFDMFCHSGRTQTLLYNLFDITHNKQSPMCVLGVTNRLDVMELLEKRVKSRFSHRHIFLFPNEEDGCTPIDNFKQVLLRLLSMPVLTMAKVDSPKKKKRIRKKSVNIDESMDIDTADTQFAVPEEILTKCRVNVSDFSELDPSFVEDWNAHVNTLLDSDIVTNAVEKLCYYTVNEQVFRNILFQLICQLSPTKPYIDAADLSAAIDKTVAPEHKVKLLQSLSILELSLVIAMKHGMDIFDGQPMNFEMVLHRYTKFANANSSAQSVPRPVILKAFEHLQALEIVVPARGESAGAEPGARREYRLCALAAAAEDVSQAVATYRALPTEISHWYSNSVF